MLPDPAWFRSYPDRGGLYIEMRRVLMRRASTCLALFGCVVVGLLGVCGGAGAVPSVKLRVKPVPIAGFPHTGDILGAGAAVEAEYQISGTEYGGFPPPLIGVNFYSPAGVKLSTKGFVTCSAATLEQKGAGACSKKSVASPKGEVNGVVAFGGERVHEAVSVQAFFSPGGGLVFNAEGNSPVALQIVSKGNFTTAPPPFGPLLKTEVPLVSTVPGAPYASVESIKIKVGAAYKKGGKVVSYITLPKKCKKGGEPVKSELLYAATETQPAVTATTSYTVPCPKK
jgi:hypothetical protein